MVDLSLIKLSVWQFASCHGANVYIKYDSSFVAGWYGLSPCGSVIETMFCTFLHLKFYLKVTYYTTRCELQAV